MTIRKSIRQPLELGTLSLYAQLDELGGAGMTLQDARRLGPFLSAVEGGLSVSLKSPSRLHGWRAQGMFAAVVLAISGVRLLTAEDEGDTYFDDAEGPVKVPDFRLVTPTGDHLLVEVKNVAPSDSTKPPRLNLAELQGLARYAEWTQGRLMFAHYWAGLNLWTLVDSSVLAVEGDRASLTIETAMPANELGLLGDAWIGTTPPLVLSLLADLTLARSSETQGDQTTEFTIGAVELLCAGRRIEHEVEREIALRLMFFGGWEPTQRAHLDAEGRLVRLDYEFTPVEPDPGSQGQAMVATLSSMYSALYNLMTLGDQGDVRSLRHEPEPGVLAQLIPTTYWDEKDRALPLWQLNVRPSAGPNSTT